MEAYMKRQMNYTRLGRLTGGGLSDLTVLLGLLNFFWIFGSIEKNKLWSSVEPWQKAGTWGIWVDEMWWRKRKKVGLAGQKIFWCWLVGFNRQAWQLLPPKMAVVNVD